MYAPPPGGLPDPFFISTMGRNSHGPVMVANGQTIASAAWPTASMAFFIPFVIMSSHTYTQAMVANGATVSGNFDIGVYNLSGTRLFSIGTTAQSGASTTQQVSISWALSPGRYFLAMAADNVTATYIRGAPSQTSGRAGGAKQMASAFVLPATATYAAFSGTAIIPLFGISESSWL